MALTPDDVVTKQFQHVRFKEGFDPDEVDDFLDEIVVEWRKTIADRYGAEPQISFFATPVIVDNAIGKVTLAAAE